MLGMRLSHKYCLICSAESTHCVKNGTNITVKMLSSEWHAGHKLGVRKGRLVFCYLHCLSLPERKEIKRTVCKTMGRQAARAIIHFSQSSRICLFRFYQEGIFMLIDLKKQLCTWCIVSVLLWMRVCVVVSLCVWTIILNVLIQARYSIHRAYTPTITPTLWETCS